MSCHSEKLKELRHFNITLKDGTECQRFDSERAACLNGKCHVSFNFIVVYSIFKKIKKCFFRM